MNIYLSFLQASRTHDIPAYSFWEFYMKNGIEEAGHTWIEGSMDWAEGLLYADDDKALNEWKSKTWESTLRDIRERHSKTPVSLFLSYLYPHQIEEHAIREIQKMGIQCVNFYCDHIRHYTKVPKEFKVFDLMWVPEYEALGMYKTSKVNHIYLPMPMWLHPQHRNLEYSEGNDISFIGSKDILRAELLSKAIAIGLDIKVRGAGWLEENHSLQPKNTVSRMFHNNITFLKKNGIRGLIVKVLQKVNSREYHVPPDCIFSKPAYEDYLKITKNSKITLGINRVPTFKTLNSSPLVYSRLRDLEAPMLGACYLTEYSKGLENLYELGKEVESYTSVEELVEKCQMLSQYPQKRNMLRAAGRKRALESHSIKKSLENIKNRLYH